MTIFFSAKIIIYYRFSSSPRMLIYPLIMLIMHPPKRALEGQSLDNDKLDRIKLIQYPPGAYTVEGKKNIKRGIKIASSPLAIAIVSANGSVIVRACDLISNWILDYTH